MADVLGEKRGFLPIAFVDENGVSYGIKQVDGRLQVDVNGISVGDISIGAVELKDATTDDRAHISADGSVLTEISNDTIEQTTGAAHTDLSIAVAGKDTAGNVQPLKTDTDRDLQVDVLSSALPTGAATAALQLPDGHNVTVDNASIAVTGTFWQATQPVSAASLPLPSGAATAANQLPPSSIGSGNKTVTTAGTQVQLASSTACKKVNITALVTNTGVIWVGGSDVAAGSGKPLVPLQDIDINVDNLADVWIDSTVNGEGVSFLYEVA